ncbi:sodium-dependent glucose transporter 1-like [Patella vulgata]|uniref:sodium-dependent glucose transporter 1-like n=1 Tax=Patella vulgata TaxID=6465 RepID=UPI0024A878BE|nr:sodium-dependent glucose transporter 1-like [Patella vulgata]
MFTMQEREEKAEGNQIRRGFLTKWKNTAYRARLLHTSWLFLSFIAMGFIAGQRGPSFLDLQLITNTDVEEASLFFTFAAVGGLLGALVIGASYDRFNKPRLIFLANIGMGVCVGVVPQCRQYPLMIFIWFITGFCMRGLETGGTADVVRVWKSESRPYMFIVHLGFSIGALISPLVTEPFLVPKHLVENQNSDIKSQDPVITCNVTNNATLNSNISCINNQTNPLQSTAYVIKLQYAFIISAILAVLTSVPFLIKSFKGESNLTKEGNSRKATEQRNVPLLYYVISVVLIMCMYICNTGIEDAFSAFLMTFVVKQMDWSKKDGALVTSAFWASLITARILVIFVADLISPAKLLLFAMCFVICALLGLWISALYLAHTGIWVFACVAGSAISILFPTGISLTDKELIPVNGKVSSFILVAGAIGLLSNPVVLGFFIKEFSALWFCYLLLGEAIMSVVLLFVILIYGRKILKRVRKTTVMEIDIDSEHGAQDTLMDDLKNVTVAG